MASRSVRAEGLSGRGIWRCAGNWRIFREAKFPMPELAESPRLMWPHLTSSSVTNLLRRLNPADKLPMECSPALQASASAGSLESAFLQASGLLVQPLLQSGSNKRTWIELKIRYIQPEQPDENHVSFLQANARSECASLVTSTISASKRGDMLSMHEDPSASIYTINRAVGTVSRGPRGINFVAEYTCISDLDGRQHSALCQKIKPPCKLLAPCIVVKAELKSL